MKKIVCTVVLSVAIFINFGSNDATAQAADGCSIQQAAQAAMERQITLLDAVKVNPKEFYSGANSCINPGLLSTIDLSRLIPSTANFLSGGVDNLIQQMIGKAQQQVCKVLNNQLQNVIGKINGKLGAFQSQLGGDLAGILGNGGSFTPVSLPNIPGIGQFNFNLTPKNSN